MHAFLALNVFAGTITKVYLNGNKLLMQVRPVTKDGAIYLHIRSFEQFGFAVNWDQTKQTVTLSDAKNLDPFGRPIKTSVKLPANLSWYPYICNSLSEEMYTAQFIFETLVTYKGVATPKYYKLPSAVSLNENYPVNRQKIWI